MTGYDAYLFDKQIEGSLGAIAQMTKTSNSGAVEKVTQLIKQQKELEKQILFFKNN